VAIRIKSRWHRSGRNETARKGFDDHASALAFITWRLSLETARKLHGEGFDYASDRERIAVMGELLAYQVQVVDRLAFDRLDDEERSVLVNALGARLADHMQDNLGDIAGPGDYRRPFIALLNDRVRDYAGLSFEDGQPGFDFVRYLGDSVLKAMGTSQTNRWVIDQIMEIEAPELAERVSKSLADLFD
jgi:hypothetical protein